MDDRYPEMKKAAAEFRILRQRFHFLWVGGILGKECRENIQKILLEDGKVEYGFKGFAALST